MCGSRRLTLTPCATIRFTVPHEGRRTRLRRIRPARDGIIMTRLGPSEGGAAAGIGIARTSGEHRGGTNMPVRMGTSMHEENARGGLQLGRSQGVRHDGCLVLEMNNCKLEVCAFALLDAKGGVLHLCFQHVHFEI